MSTSVTLFSAFDALEIKADRDDSTVWVFARRNGVLTTTLALDLSLADIEALETAAAAARMNLAAQAAREAA